MEAKEETKELVIRVNKSLYDEIMKSGFDKMWNIYRGQAQYLLEVLLCSKDRDKELLSNRAIGNIADIASLLCKIQSIEEPQNLNLKYNYKYLDDFLNTHDPCYMKSLLADIMCDYGSAIILGADEDIQKFVDNVSLFKRLNELISLIVYE